MEPQTEAKPATANQVAKLAGANMPADNGLTGLGLLMQLAGSLFLAYGAFIAASPILEDMRGGPRMSLFAIGVASAIRSAYHRSAGAGLLYGSPKGPLHRLKIYIIVGIAQSAAVSLFLLNMDMPGKLALFFFVVLAAWPTTLAFVMQTKRFKSISDDLPKSEDMGFESAAVLMTIFGFMGSLAMGLFIVTMFKSDAFVMSDVPSLLWMSVMILLFIRSVLHARAGLQGTMGANAERASESAARYFNFGITVSVIAGAVFMMQMIMMQGTLHFALFTMVAVGVYMLLVWPMALRNFFTDRNFSMLLDEQGFTRRAPDTGLTALGWLLLSLGVMGLSVSLAAVVFLKGKLMGVDLMLLSRMAVPGAHSQWWMIGVSGLQVAAGLELIGMSDRHRIVATAYGAVTMVVTTYLWWPVISQLSKASSMDPVASAEFYAQLLLSLTVPVATLLLVNRNWAPDARARIRE